MTILTSAQTESWALAERPHAPHNAVKTKTVIHSQFRHARADTPSWLSPTRTPPKLICALPDDVATWRLETLWFATMFV